MPTIMPTTPEIDVELQTLIQKHLRGDECIEFVMHNTRDETVTAMVISREMKQQLEKMPAYIRRKAGGGRNLSFEMREGKWCFTGQGFWIR